MTSRVVVDSNVIFLKKLHNSISEYMCPLPLYPSTPLYPGFIGDHMTDRVLNGWLMFTTDCRTNIRSELLRARFPILFCLFQQGTFQSG